MHAPDRMTATHIVATPQSLDALTLPKASILLRIAPDEALILPPLSLDQLRLKDKHAIVVQDGGFAGLWLPIAEAVALCARLCDFELPAARPSLAQGALAGIAAKLYFEESRALILFPAPLIEDFEERVR